MKGPEPFRLFSNAAVELKSLTGSALECEPDSIRTLRVRQMQVLLLLHSTLVRGHRAIQA